MGHFLATSMVEQGQTADARLILGLHSRTALTAKKKAALKGGFPSNGIIKVQPAASNPHGEERSGASRTHEASTSTSSFEAPLTRLLRM